MASHVVVSLWLLFFLCTDFALSQVRYPEERHETNSSYSGPSRGLYHQSPKPDEGVTFRALTQGIKKNRDTIDVLQRQYDNINSILGDIRLQNPNQTRTLMDLLSQIRGLRRGKSCPDGAWVADPLFETCYLISFGYRSWEDAQEFCIEQNANLVTLDSADKQSILSRFRPAWPSLGFWIGLRDSDVDGSVDDETWQDGTLVAFTDLFSPVTATEPCVYWSTAFRAWYTASCDARENIDTICEVPWEVQEQVEFSRKKTISNKRRVEDRLIADILGYNRKRRPVVQITRSETDGEGVFIEETDLIEKETRGGENGQSTSTLGETERPSDKIKSPVVAKMEPKKDSVNSTSDSVRERGEKAPTTRPRNGNQEMSSPTETEKPFFLSGRVILNPEDGDERYHDGDQRLLLKDRIIDLNKAFHL